MDISTPLIFVSLFLLASLSLFLVYKYGIKEKSYEEALAEQRQQTNALLGVKPKPKEKKNKKAAKKSKEKQPSLQENESDESENVDTGNNENSQTNKLHVEFKEEPEEVPVKEIVQIKLKRVKKVRPILVKKNKSSEKVILDVIETPIINHFEENPPKDDLELLRSNSRDDINKQEPAKEKVTKEKKQNLEVASSIKYNKKAAKQQAPANIVVEVVPPVVEKEIEEKVVEAVVIVPQTNGVVGNPGKEKKKKKSEFNTRQQLTAERDGLINSVRKAELSKTEVQLLIDLLLNKQLEAPSIIGDWSEGKSDPMQKLKRQLAEKEKALAEEQEAMAGVQAKLKEVRAEQLAEKSQLQQKIKGLEEHKQVSLIEVQAANNRLQVSTQKIQQLQAELNAEVLKTHKLRDEIAALQMQAEVRTTQVQENDGIVGKLRSDIEELSNQNQQLRLELQQNLVEKDQQQQHFLMQMGSLEKGLKQQIQQLEESHQELERNLELALRKENEWEIKISKLNTKIQKQFEDMRTMEHAAEQLREELREVNAEKIESAKIIAQLKSELQLKDQQICQVNGSSKDKEAHEVEILNLTNELSSVKNELSSIKTELQQTEGKYKTELENSDKQRSKIQNDLEEQKAKNNELRTKNWKVMEALSAAESRSKASNSSKQSDINLDKLTSEIRTKEQDSQKQFIQRLFPEIEDLHGVTSDDWQTEFGKLIKSYVSNLSKQQSTPASVPEESQYASKLEAQLQHYKNVINDTEGMLNNLQLYVEKEEINWRNQLVAKEAEIEHLKASRLTALQTKVLSLEQQLSQEISEKKQILQECQVLRSNKSPSNEDATATVEKLSEEVHRLREQLRVEQIKNGDVNVCYKAQNNSNSTNGPSFIEHCLSSSSSLASSVIEEYSKKPKNKKKKKKVSATRNANICSNMGCQFLYCDGKSCHGN